MRRQTCSVESCVSCPSRAKTVVCDLQGDDVVEFQRVKRSIMYEARKVVFYEGHAALGIYVLCAGTVKLTRSSARGQRQIVRIVGPGGLIEKQVFRLGSLHDTTCETLEPCQVCVVDQSAYLQLLAHRPAVALRLLHLLSGEFSTQLDQLGEFTFKSVRERMAGLLVDLGERFGTAVKDGGVVVNMSLKREEVAELAGTTVETAIRLLGAFKQEGLVTVNGRAITLLQPERLHHIARA